jgi:hypothetical protein
VTETEQLRLQFLTWLYDYHCDPAGAVPSLGDFLRENVPALPEEFDDYTQRLWRGTLRGLHRDGLIILADGYEFAGMSAVISEKGRAAVEASRAREAAEHAGRERRRADPALCRAAAVNGLLRWSYEQDPDGGQWLSVDEILTSVHSMFEGEHLPEQVIRRAAQYLRENELLRGDSAVAGSKAAITVQLTPKGRDCVESGGDVADYLRQKNDRATTITFNGPVSGNVSWDSNHVTQTASTTGLAGDEIGLLVRAIAEAIPALGLPDEQASAVRNTVDVIEGELARTEPDQHVVKAMMRRTLDALAGATSSTLGLLLTGYAKELMKNAGIPIE